MQSVPMIIGPPNAKIAALGWTTVPMEELKPNIWQQYQPYLRQ
jgi:hypothetical protein